MRGTRDASFTIVLKAMIAATALVVLACVDAGFDATPGVTIDENCEPALLPDDGACAHACDPAALISYIPEGTCASFACPMTDGSTYFTGGCHR